MLRAVCCAAEGLQQALEQPEQGSHKPLQGTQPDSGHRK